MNCSIPSLQVLLTVLILAMPSLNIECFNSFDLESPANVDDPFFKMARFINQVTGEFFQINRDNLFFQTENVNDFIDPQDENKWYRKVVIPDRDYLYIPHSERYSHKMIWQDNNIDNIVKGLEGASVFNQEQDRPGEVPFATKVTYFGCFQEQGNKDKVLFIAMEGGRRNIKLSLLDPDVIKYFEDPRNRMDFYVSLALLLKRLVENLKMRVCNFSSDGIGLQLYTDDNGNHITPVIRDTYHAVALGERCWVYDTFYNPTSVAWGDIEMTEKFERRIEVFSLGALVYYMESSFTMQYYDGNKVLPHMPTWLDSLNPPIELKQVLWTAKTNQIQNHYSVIYIWNTIKAIESAERMAPGNGNHNYSNKTLKTHLLFMRKVLQKYLELNPLFSSSSQSLSFYNAAGSKIYMEANRFMQRNYREFLEYMDTLMNQNNMTMYQRPTYDEVIVKLRRFYEDYNTAIEKVDTAYYNFGSNFNKHYLII